MSVLVSQATATARELVAHLLMGVPIYAALHTSQPQPTDPTATIARTSGNQTARVTWKQAGVVLSNSLPLTFAGIDQSNTVSWLALGTDSIGSGLLFIAEFSDPEPASAGDGVITIPIDALHLIVA